MYLSVIPLKSSNKFCKGVKFSLRYVGTFKIIKKLGPTTYFLALPSTLDCMHDVLNESSFHHYILHHSHIIDLSYLHMSDEREFKSKPIFTLN
jgi:hypothetical protein